MANMVKTIEVTKEYVKYFNARDLAGLSELLDDNDVIFTRQSQPTIIGKKVILHRTHRLFKRLEEHAQTLTMVNAIIDLPEKNAYPCMIGVLDGERFAVCLLDLKANGKVKNITILLNPDSVQKARPTEKALMEKAMAVKEQPDRKALELRAKGLRKKETKLKRRILKEGHTHELALKMARLQAAKKRLEVKINEMGEAG